jgi:hypothetical protein
MNPEKRTILPSLAFRGFQSRYQPPKLSEGFQDIYEVQFKVREGSHTIELDFDGLTTSLTFSSKAMSPTRKRGYSIGIETLIDLMSCSDLQPRRIITTTTDRPS